MNKNSKYRYHYRPGYGSKNLLIHFLSGVENETFDQDFFDAIKFINPKIVNQQDLWMNDEVVYNLISDLGEFMISKDIWNFAFVMSENNQSCLFQINAMLINYNRFEKIDVDFDEFNIKNLN